MFQLNEPTQAALQILILIQWRFRTTAFRVLGTGDTWIIRVLMVTQ